MAAALAVLACAAGLVHAQPAIEPHALLGSCKDVALAKDHVLVLDGSGRLTEWRLEDGAFSRDLSALGRARKIASVQDDRLAIQRSDGSLDIFDARRLERLARLGEPLAFRDFDVSAQGRVLAALSRDRISLTVFQSAGGALKAVKVVRAPGDAEITQFALSPDGNTLGMVSEGGAAHVVSLAQGHVSKVDLRGQPFRIYPIAADNVFIQIGSDYMAMTEEYTRKGAGGWQVLKGTYMGTPVRAAAADQPVLFMTGGGLGWASMLATRSEDLQGSKDAREKSWVLPISQNLRAVAWDAATGSLISCAEKAARWQMPQVRMAWSTPAHPSHAAIIDQITVNARYASLSDWEGRTAVWNLSTRRYERELPPLKRLVYPTLGGLSEDGRILSSFGHAGVLTLFRSTDTDLWVNNVSMPELSTNTWEYSALYSELKDAFILKTGSQLMEMRDLREKGRTPPAPLIKVDASETGCDRFFGRDAVSQSGRFVIAGCANGGVLVSDLSLDRHAFVKLHGLENSRTRRSWVAAVTWQSEKIAYIATRTDLSHARDDLDRIPEEGASRIYELDVLKRHAKVLPVRHPQPVTALAIDPKRQTLFAASFLGAVTEFDLKSGKVMRRLDDVASAIGAMSYDQDEDRLILANGSSILRTVRPGADHADIDTVFFPSGHFLARRRDGSMLASYPVIADLLGSNRHTVWVNAPTLLNEKATPGPMIWHPNPSLPAPASLSVEHREGRLSLRIKTSVAATTDVPLHTLVFIDGRLFSVRPFLPEMSVELPTMSDEEVVSVAHYSPVKGYGAFAFAETEAASTPKKGQLLGFFVGIDDYERYPKLVYARSDAKKMAEAMSQYGRQPSHQKVFPDSVSPTTEAVVRFLETGAASSKPEDTVVIFLAGHGDVSRGSFFFATSESVPDGLGGASSSRLSSEKLMALIQKIPANQIFLMIDACNGGSFNADWNAAYVKSGLATFSGMRQAPNRKSVYLAAAALDTGRAKEGWQGKGLFTSVLLDALSEPRTNNEGSPLSTSSLLYHLAEKMPKLARQAFHRDIRPVLSFGITDIDITQGARP